MCYFFHIYVIQCKQNAIINCISYTEDRIDHFLCLPSQIEVDDLLLMKAILRDSMNYFIKSFLHEIISAAASIMEQFASLNRRVGSVCIEFVSHAGDLGSILGCDRTASDSSTSESQATGMRFMGSQKLPKRMSHVTVQVWQITAEYISKFAALHR